MATMFEDPSIPFLVVLMTVTAVLLAIAVYASRYQRVPPDKALIVYGRATNQPQTVTDADGRQRTVMRRAGPRIITGGGTFVMPVIERIAWLSIETHTVEVEIPEMLTKPGIPLNIEGVGQVRIGSDADSLRIAAQQLLEKQDAEIIEMSRRIIESHLRTICINLTIEEINADRALLSKELMEAASPDFARLGLRLTIFVIKDIRDRVGYLESLGMKRTAEVRRIAQLQAEHALKGEPGTQLVLSERPVRVGDTVKVVGLSPGGMYIVRPLADRPGEA